jgi:hypothetical protein
VTGVIEIIMLNTMNVMIVEVNIEAAMLSDIQVIA